MGNYGDYINIRNNSWKCLIEHKICSLPVDIIKITDEEKNIRVIKNSTVGLLHPKENGRSYYDGKTWCIIYEDKNPPELSRYVIAHELGHYYLHHEIKYTRYIDGRHYGKSISESQADMFARRLLCPSCVLWGMGLHTPSDIASYCRVEMSIAQERARRLKLLCERSCFLKSTFEQELFALFTPYIKEHTLLK